MTESLLSHPYSGLILSIAAYWVAVRVKSKTASPLANPLLVSVVLIIASFQLTPMTLEHYRNGASLLSMLIVPATTVLALQINRQWHVLRANVVPVLGGCVVGSVVSMASIGLLCSAFGIDEVLTASFLPKSVTTAISMELSERSGGIAAITVSAVILTGLISAVLSPVLLKKFRLDNAVAAGVGLGVSGHAVGTATALSLGETEGALASISLAVTALATSLLYAVLVFHHVARTV